MCEKYVVAVVAYVVASATAVASVVCRGEEQDRYDNAALRAISDDAWARGIARSDTNNTHAALQRPSFMAQF